MYCVSYCSLYFILRGQIPEVVKVPLYPHPPPFWAIPGPLPIYPPGYWGKTANQKLGSLEEQGNVTVILLFDDF